MKKKKILIQQEVNMFLQMKYNILIREFWLKLRLIYTKDNNQVNMQIYSMQSTLVTLPNRPFDFFLSEDFEVREL